MKKSLEVHTPVKITELSMCVPDAEVGDEGVIVKIYGPEWDPEGYEVKSVDLVSEESWQGIFPPEYISPVRMAREHIKSDKFPLSLLGLCSLNEYSQNA